MGISVGMFPLAQLFLEGRAQFIGGEIEGHGFAD
jgi:hypothetical protein